MKDINNRKEFYEWLRETFDWIDNDVKSLMYRAWCARRKTFLTPKGEQLDKQEERDDLLQ